MRYKGFEHMLNFKSIRCQQCQICHPKEAITQKIKDDLELKEHKHYYETEACYDCRKEHGIFGHYVFTKDSEQYLY